MLWLSALQPICCLKMQPAEAFPREQFRGYNAANTEQEEGKQKGQIWEATKEAEWNAEQLRSSG